MGELIRIFIPACRIRELFLSGAKANMVPVFTDLSVAKHDCELCLKAGMTKCPYEKPRILPLDVAEELNELYYDVGS